MTKFTRIALASLSLVAAAGLTACNNNKADESKATPAVASSAPINKSCPVSGKPASAEITSTHEGKTVAFCCPGCKGKFDKMDDAGQDAMVAKAK